MGKPSEFMLANIADKFGLRRDQMCMVGDRLDTDVMFGKNGGLATMLVLSGQSVPLCGTMRAGTWVAPKPVSWEGQRAGSHAVLLGKRVLEWSLAVHLLVRG